MSLIRKGYRHIKYFLQKKAIVLSYHRVIDIAIDPWDLAVSPKNFEEHLQVLKKYNLVTPDQLVGHLKKGTVQNKMVCITFDDGYQDNYLLARPLLEKYESPLAIFIPIHYIGEEKQFWWDELQSIILGEHDLPKWLSVFIGDETLEFDLGDEAIFNQVHHQLNLTWRSHEETKTKRAELYLEIWKRLRPLEYHKIDSVLQNLRKWSSGSTAVDRHGLPMTAGQLNEIIAHPLFDVGVHTVTHPALASHKRKDQLTEIESCKKRLEQLSAKKINAIAYPYGDYDNNTIEIAEQLAFEAGFTTEGRAVRSNDHPLKLPRFQVKNWDGYEFAKHLNFWIKGY